MQTVVVKDLGLTDYEPVFTAMREYTAVRDGSSADQLWFTQHRPVFTQGQAGKAEHVLNPGDIPVINTDRGGQVTYHGPGQLVILESTKIPHHRRLLGSRRRNSSPRTGLSSSVPSWAVV